MGTTFVFVKISPAPKSAGDYTVNYAGKQMTFDQYSNEYYYEVVDESPPLSDSQHRAKVSVTKN